jgi:hypothetical protein
MNISLKTKIKYWWSFLRLTHQSKEIEIINALKDSVDFYKAWGDFRTGSFDPWWREHSHLFHTRNSMTKMNVGETASDDALYLRVPFTYAPTTASTVFERIYRKEYEKKQTTKRKVKKVYGGTYSLSDDDFQTSQFEYYLRFTKDVYLPIMSNSPNSQTKPYVCLAIERFKNQKLKSSLGALARRKVPFTYEIEKYETQRRLASRYRTYSHNIMLNVAKGIFPGEYEEVSIKNQAIKRKASPPVRSQKRGVPQSLYVDTKKRESGFDMYAKRGPKKIAKV